MSPATHTLDVTVPVDRSEIAQAVARSLSVEAADTPERTNVRVEAHGSELRFHFEASETRGLRAIVHSYLRWADTSIAVARRATSG